MDKVIAVVDMGFGSSGKGLLAGSLAHIVDFDTVIHANHPNAGHTFQKDGQRWVFRMTANSFIAPPVKHMLIGPGAVLDVQCLIAELLRIQVLGLLGDKQVIIHPNCTVLTQEHAAQEKQLVAIGSTMKGSAEAVISKMRRHVGEQIIAKHHNREIALQCYSAGIKNVHVSRDQYEYTIDSSRSALIEGAQGASLSIHSRFYPYCTSRDVSIHQMFSDCALPRMDKVDLIVAGTIRTFPIRVANRFDTDGNQIGSSGGTYMDQVELDWQKDLHREPELTTVTRLPRRIFTFSREQLLESCRINRPDMLFLSFCDYLSEEAGVNQQIPLSVSTLRASIQDMAHAPVRILSYGPDFTDMRFAMDDSQYVLSDEIFTAHVW